MRDENYISKVNLERQSILITFIVLDSFKQSHNRHDVTISYLNL
ncbi:38772_t:CDS:2 [Gigaspora margarita]|uniref:38772_t:CDS:1 n=1 Tax=Gigaspora margarita TaxID=4874 RepID=A0ABN7V0Z3_GIGMA|nr:38772_t:CDS:2 [Gigaspora margarita]